MLKRNIFRDWIVYSITSIRFLLLKGHLNLFVKDMSYFSQWRIYRLSSKGTLDYRIPWLVFSSISFLEKWLHKNMKLFEYGSGGSTLFFAEKTAHIISAEHDRQWYKNTKTAIEESGLMNIEYELFEPEPDTDISKRDCKNPDHYISCFAEYKQMQFKKYATAIDAYPEASFDLVIVDGRVRHSCIAHAMKKIKKNGALLLDNADRTYYLDPFPDLFDQHKWKHVNFRGHFPYGPASILNTTKLFIKL